MTHVEEIEINGVVYWHKYLSNIHPDAEIGTGSVIHSHVWIGKDVKIGKNCKIQAFVFIPDGVTIEDNCFLAPHVVLTNDPNLEVKGKSCWKPTLIKKGAKIGAGAKIKAGVVIGEGAIIGMGAVVTKNVPPGETWVGNPAKILQKITPDMMDAYHPDVNKPREFRCPIHADGLEGMGYWCLCK